MSLAPALTIAFSGLYAMPAAFGLGEHWPLEESDADLLGERLADALKNVPAKTAQRIFKITDTWFPWVAFVLALWAITMPRIQLTRELANARRRERIEGNEQHHGAAQAQGTGVVGSIHPNGAAADSPIAPAGGSDVSGAGSVASVGVEGRRPTARDVIDGVVTPL